MFPTLSDLSASALRLLLLSLLILVAAHAPALSGPGASNNLDGRRVLIIGIDGVQRDALRTAMIQGRTPNLAQLATTGLTHWGMEAGGHYHTDRQQPTITGPGWGAVLSGVYFNKHGVYDNNNLIVDRNYYLYPHVFKHIREMYPDVWLGSAGHATTPNGVLTRSGDGIANLIYSPTAAEKAAGQGDEKVSEMAVSILQTEDPDALFLHYLDGDNTGHAYGYGKTVPEYMNTLADIDGNVGQVLTALRARPQFAQEKWLICVTSDHGGDLAKTHGGQSADHREIFAIFNGPGFTGGRIDNSLVHQGMVPPTVLNYLGIGVNPTWGMEEGPAVSIPPYPPAKHGISFINPRRDIRYPKPGETIQLTVDVHSVDPLVEVNCHVATGTGAFLAKPMTLVEGTQWQVDLGPFPDNTCVKYYFQAATATQVSKLPLALAPLPFYVLRVDSAPVDGTDLVINEIMYNPPGADNSTNSEWMEIYNRRSTPVDASFFWVADTETQPEDFVLPEGTIVPANGYLILAWDKALFLSKYPALASRSDVVVVDTNQSYVLNNDKDSPCLSHPNDYQWNHLPTECFDVVPYVTDSPAWPAAAPDGFSIELINPARDNTRGENWKRGAAKDGTPGAQNSQYIAGGTFVESVSRNDENPLPSQPLVLTARVAAEGPVTVQAVVDRGSGPITLPMAPQGNNNYMVNLGVHSSNTLISYYVTASGSGVTSTFPAGAPAGERLRVRVLNIPVLPGDLVINEIQYDPAGGDGTTAAEWFEIYNNTPRTQDLSYFTYRMKRDTDFYTIPPGTTIAPNGYLVITGLKNVFNTTYPNFSSTGAGLLGHDWGVNALINGNGSLQEVRLVGVNTLPTTKWGPTPAIDAVPYRAGNYPWPGEGQPINLGFTYELRHPSLDTSNGGNWRMSKAAKGTPGQKNSVYEESATVADWALY